MDHGTSGSIERPVASNAALTASKSVEKCWMEAAGGVQPAKHRPHRPEHLPGAAVLAELVWASRISGPVSAMEFSRCTRPLGPAFCPRVTTRSAIGGDAR